MEYKYTYYTNGSRAANKLAGILTEMGMVLSIVERSVQTHEGRLPALEIPGPETLEGTTAIMRHFGLADLYGRRRIATIDE